MADSTSDADKIRNKRLAKLQGQNAGAKDGQIGEASKASVEQSSNASQQAEVEVSTEQKQPQPPAPEKGQNPFSQLVPEDANAASPKINITPISKNKNVLKREHPSSDEKVASTPSVTPGQWEDEALRSIFRVTLDEKIQQDAQGHRLQFLIESFYELQSTEKEVRLRTGVLDQVLLEAGTIASAEGSPLDYFVRCWKRASREHRTVRPIKESAEPESRQAVFAEAKRLCMSYCIFAFTMPEMFGYEPTTNPLTPLLLLDSGDDRGLDHDFFAEVIKRMPSDEAIEPAITTAAGEVSKQLARLTMNDDFKKYVAALRNLVQYPTLVNAITRSPHFLPADVPASTFEADTLLGPFFAISPLQRDVTTQYFSSPATLSKSYISNSQQSLRLALQTHQMELLDIANRIIKTGQESRERMLDWFAQSLNINHKRRALHVKAETVSSDGFMINVTVCLDQLCEPFMDATFSKIDRIDVDYLRRNPRVDIKDETKLKADQKVSDEFYDKRIAGTSNFISEVFFLTLAAHHYGTEATNATLGTMEKDLKRMQKHISEVELDRHKFLADPVRLRMFDEAVKKYKDSIDKGLSYKYAVEGVLLDELNQGRSMQFMRYVVVWLLRLVSPGYPKDPLKLPLPENETEVFQCLPEYFLEDVVSNFKFIMGKMSHIITATQSEELVMLCITFLRCGEYIKNPYLKSGLVTILFHGIWPTYHRSRGVLGDLLNALPFATQYLLHALMKFYIDVETTGSHTQFFDKFNIRYEIFQIIKCVWSTPSYRDQLSQEAKVNLDFFVRFVNLLLNDVTFVLDESLSAFVEIHKLTQELKQSGADMEPAIRTEKEEALSAAKGRAKSYMQLTNETVAMLKLFTEALADSFTKPEIVQRLADMLDYNLEAMVGPKSMNLDVENREEYHFRPRQLLSDIVDVYLNLRTKENFILAVARDGRSYKPEILDKATQRLTQYSLKSPQQIKQWKNMGERIRKAKEEDDQDEEDLEDAPEEFMDPLLFHLMSDPVILPTSKTSMDRSTIRSHLLSDPNDPFNRAPLKIEDVVPDTALAARIQAFKDERKQARLKARADAANNAANEGAETTAGGGQGPGLGGDGAMDLSPG